MADLDALLSSLAVPAEFAKYDDLDDANVLVNLDRWKTGSIDAAAGLRDLLLSSHNGKATVVELPLGDHARVAAAASSLIFENEWTTEASRLRCQEILDALDPTPTLLVEVLATVVKPIFQRNPHPHLNIETGRKLSRPAGGAGATLDVYDVQDWKGHPTVVCTLRWCARQCSTGAWEKIWHLLIPPMMTLLDDFEVRWKQAGLSLAQDVIEGAPPMLLTRTGVDGLLYQSLQTALTHVRDVKSAELLRVAVQTTLKLIIRTTTPGSEPRASRLFVLLGDGIIGTVWTYGTNAPDLVLASYEVLPDVLKVIGIGSARYLKGMIPQLLHPLQPSPPVIDHPPEIVKTRVLALRALQAVIGVCAARMHRWKGTILETIAKCWTEVTDAEAFDDVDAKGRVALKAELASTCAGLAAACRSVVENEFAMLVQHDSMFVGLVNGYHV